LYQLLHPLFTILTRPPHPPPLFPYTTLFRSRASHPRARRLSHGAPCARRGPGRIGSRGTGERRGAADRGDDGVPCGGEGQLPAEDRKSTRLNSSHQIISYAVFCLKKKKN